jgi:anti-sigma-K factor RskA
MALSARATSLACYVANRELSAPKQAVVGVAAINRGGDKPALIIRVDSETATVFVRPVAPETPCGKTLELWLIPEGGKPKSISVLGTGAQHLPAPKRVALEKASFAVTMEPSGGSPTGNPTGSIVYSGALARE